jgi:hypothetical protein
VRALYLLTPLASQPLDIPAPLIPRDRTGCSYNLARSVTLLILNSYTLHFTTTAIKFCIALKIISFCLSLYTTYLLQLLGVKIFCLLATVYKINV